MKVGLRTALLPAAVFAAAGGVMLAGGSEPRLRADISNPFADTDGDLVPDSLEAVLFSHPGLRDTDGDGSDDFLEIVRFTSPAEWNSASYPLDHEMRIVLSVAASGANGAREVWLHCLFRFASGRFDLGYFNPYLATATGKVSIADLFGRTPFRISSRYVPAEGSYAILTMKFADEAAFLPLLPCTIGATASVGGRVLSTGTHVMTVGGEPVAILPRGRDTTVSFLMQSIRGQDPAVPPFFRGNKICEFELIVVGSNGQGHVCEVEGAACTPANGLRCSVNCEQATGSIIFVPDGLRTLTGR